MADPSKRAKRANSANTGATSGNPAAPAPEDAAATAGRPREYRTAELAEAAGITTRTLRFYRERRLLPPPRREGRIAWYDEHHLARLRTISALLARGHTLGGIADLMEAFEAGRDSRGTAELLGLDPTLATPFAEETPVRLTPEELASYYEGGVDVDNLAASLDIGYIAVDGDEFVHSSRRLLEASSALVEQGIPLAAVLAAGRALRTHADAVADLFTELFRAHLLPRERAASPTGTVDPEHLYAALARLRPYTKQVVDAEIGLALDRRLRAEAQKWTETEGDA